MPTNGKIIYAINQNSLEIYDGIVNKTIKIKKIYDLIKNKIDIKELKIKGISNNTMKKVIKSYDKMDYLDDILYLMKNRYSHLRGIINVVNLDDLLDYILPNDVLIEKVKLDYSNKIIDLLLEKYYDYENAKLLSKLKEELNILDNKLNIKIVKKLNEYYVKRITV